MRWAQTFIGTGVNASQEKWGGQTFSDLYTAYFDVGSRPADYLGFDFHIGYGPTPAIWAGLKGNERSYRFGMDIKPLDRLTLEPFVRYVKSTEVNTGQVLYRQMILRNRLRLQMNRQLSVRLVVQYNDGAERWEVDPLITYRLSSFSVFYLGSTYDYNEMLLPENQRDWTLTNRQFFMKIQYLFQI